MLKLQIEVKTINIHDIHGAKYNPRNISSTELTKLKNNINEFGIVDPIIVNLKNMTIVGGHQRYKALVDEGLKELHLIEIGNIGWVFNTTDLDIENDEAEKILNLALNNISGEWDEGQLSSVLQELKQKTTNYTLTGFDDIDIEQLRIDTEVLFDENVIGKSWDKFKKAQGEDDWQDKYKQDEELPEDEILEEEYEEDFEDELEDEEEDLLNLHDGIIKDDFTVFEDEIKCPQCGHTITMDMFEKNYFDKVDDL